MPTSNLTVVLAEDHLNNTVLVNPMTNMGCLPEWRSTWTSSPSRNTPSRQSSIGLRNMPPGAWKTFAESPHN
jgi:hypothetical protein